MKYLCCGPEAICPTEMQSGFVGVQHHAQVNRLMVSWFGVQSCVCFQNGLYTFCKFCSLLLSLNSISFFEILDIHP